MIDAPPVLPQREERIKANTFFNKIEKTAYPGPHIETGR